MSSSTRKLRFLSASTTCPSSSTFSSTAISTSSSQLDGGPCPPTRGPRRGSSFAATRKPAGPVDGDSAHRGGPGRQHYPLYEVRQPPDGNLRCLRHRLRRALDRDRAPP